MLFYLIPPTALRRRYAQTVRDSASSYKIDGVAPLMTDPPPISSTTLSGKKKKKNDTWHMTRDTWHVTRDTWHLTRDMWHLTCDMFGGGWTFSQNFSSLGLTVCDLWYYEDILGKGWLTQSISQSITRLFVGQPRLHRVRQIDYVIVITTFLNPEGHQNPISGSKLRPFYWRGGFCLLVELQPWRVCDQRGYPV